MIVLIALFYIGLAAFIIWGIIKTWENKNPIHFPEKE